MLTWIKYKRASFLLNIIFLKPHLPIKARLHDVDSMQQSHVAQISPFKQRAFVARRMFLSHRVNAPNSARNNVYHAQRIVVKCTSCKSPSCSVRCVSLSWVVACKCCVLFNTLTLMFFGFPVYLRSLSLKLLQSPEMRVLAAGKLIHRQRFSDTYTLSPAHSR